MSAESPPGRGEGPSAGDGDTADEVIGRRSRGAGVACSENLCNCPLCEEAMGRLWTVQPRIVAGLRRRGANHAVADEIAAEAYVTAWRKLADVPRSLVAAERWLHGTARRLLANYRRVDARRQRHHERYARMARVDGHDRGWVGDPGDVPDRLALWLAWGHLGAEERRILWMVAVAGLGPTELAERLDCSVGSARTRLWRARRRLADLAS